MIFKGANQDPSVGKAHMDCDLIQRQFRIPQQMLCLPQPDVVDGIYQPLSGFLLHNSRQIGGTDMKALANHSSLQIGVLIIGLNKREHLFCPVCVILRAGMKRLLQEQKEFLCSGAQIWEGTGFLDQLQCL